VHIHLPTDNIDSLLFVCTSCLGYFYWRVQLRDIHLWYYCIF